jgi:hypothetical protein
MIYTPMVLADHVLRQELLLEILMLLVVEVCETQEARTFTRSFKSQYVMPHVKGFSAACTRRSGTSLDFDCTYITLILDLKNSVHAACGSPREVVY